MLRCIGVLAHPRRPQTAPIAEAFVQTLRQNGLQAWLYAQWDDSTVQADIPNADMVVAIGGDGAMLKAARVCAPFRVPVLGVNMGRLGFLTEVQGAEEWDNALKRLISGDYWIETRMMLHATVRRGNVILAKADALNDVVVSGNAIGNMIQLDAYIDNHWTTTYNADGLIIATPTGSTAYALAAGGPILPPDLKNILIVPAAPHLSMERAIVLSEGSTVAVRSSEDNRHTVVLSADGFSMGILTTADTITIRASEHSSRFVRLRAKNYFYRSLLDRLEPRINRRNDTLLTELPEEEN